MSLPRTTGCGQDMHWSILLVHYTLGLLAKTEAASDKIHFAEALQRPRNRRHERGGEVEIE